MDNRIFNVRMWLFLCVHIHMCVGHTNSKSAYFWLGKTLRIFLCAPDGDWTSGQGIHLILGLTSTNWATPSPTVTLTLKIGTHTFCITLRVMYDDTPTYQVQFRKAEWFRRYYPDKYSLKIWTLTVSLTFSTAIKKIFVTQHSSSWWCTTVPNLVAKGSEVQEIWKLFFENLSPHCDLDLVDRNFSHDTPGHHDAPSHQVWLHTV